MRGIFYPKEQFQLVKKDNCGMMFEKLSYLGRDLLLETIDKLIEGQIVPIKQDVSKVTFAYNVTKEEERLDFTKTAQEVYNHIRAYYPSPIAYTIFNGENFKNI